MTITKEAVQEILYLLVRSHDKIIKQIGGELGIRDEAGLYHSVYRILHYQQNHRDNPFKIGAFILLELGKRHHFVDSNKRIAYLAMKIFLINLGYHFKIGYKDASYFIIKIIDFHSSIPFDVITNWILENSVHMQLIDLESYLNDLILEFYYGN